MEPYIPTFFSACKAVDVASNLSWLPTYMDLYESRIKELSDPNEEAFHLWEFMPPPSYEDTIGLMLKAGELYIPAFGETESCLFRVYVDSSKKTEFKIYFGVFVVDVCSKGGELYCQHGNSSISLSKSEIQLTCKRHNNVWYLGVEGKSLGEVKVDGKYLVPKISVQHGEVAIIMAQSLSPLPSFIFFESVQGERYKHIETERNPYRFDWGLRTLRISGILIMATVLRDLYIAYRDNQSVCIDEKLLRRLNHIVNNFSDQHQHLLNAYLAWPRWRPGVGDYPENGPWDRNSFSNGSIALSVALLSRLVTDFGDSEYIQATVHRRASIFFQAQEFVGFLRKSKSRNAKWWIRRSANHGMVMMFTFLTAMQILGMNDSNAAKLVDRVLFTSLETLYQDGSFCEGIHYNGFALIFLLPYLSSCRDEFSAHVESFCDALPRLYDWWSLSHDHEGKVFANFGDNVARDASKDRVSIGQFLKSYSPVDLCDSFNFGRVDVFTPFVSRSLKDQSIHYGLYTKVFNRNQFVLSTYINELKQRTSGLFIIGSKSQATHNHNHDCVGFAFYNRSIQILIDKSQGQPTGNNSICFVDGKGPVNFQGTRSYNGKVRSIKDSENDECLLEASFEAKVILGGYGEKDLRVLRRFLFTPNQPCLLKVTSQIWGVPELSPALTFKIAKADNENWRLITCFSLTKNYSWKSLKPTFLNQNTLIFKDIEAQVHPVTFITFIGSALQTEQDIAATASSMLG